MNSQLAVFDLEEHVPAPPSSPSVVFSLTVFGTPAPAGSKRAFVNKFTNRAHVTDANPNAAPWKKEVSQAAGRRMDELGLAILTGPLEVTFRFFRKRPLGHSGAKGLKPSAPAYPTSKPDVLKLARGVEDALTGIVYADDAVIVNELLFKRYGFPERVEIEIRAAQ